MLSFTKPPRWQCASSERPSFAVPCQALHELDCRCRLLLLGGPLPSSAVELLGVLGVLDPLYQTMGLEDLVCEDEPDKDHPGWPAQVRSSCCCCAPAGRVPGDGLGCQHSVVELCTGSPTPMAVQPDCKIRVLSKTARKRLHGSWMHATSQRYTLLPSAQTCCQRCHQVRLIRKRVEPCCLRRLRSAVDSLVVPRLEVAMPVRMPRQQAAAYKTVLTRFYEMLADPKPPRHSGHRAAQMRSVVAELRKVCTHPCLIQDFEQAPASGPAAVLAERLAASGKLQLLDRLLQLLKADGHKVLLLSQMPKVWFWLCKC